MVGITCWRLGIQGAPMLKRANADETGGHRTLQWRRTEPNDKKLKILVEQ
jgi:hypothetical protein